LNPSAYNQNTYMSLHHKYSAVTSYQWIVGTGRNVTRFATLCSKKPCCTPMYTVTVSILYMPTLSALGLVSSITISTSVYRVWLQRYQWHGKYWTDSQSVKFSTITVTMTRNTAIQSFHKTLQLIIMMYIKLSLVAT